MAGSVNKAILVGNLGRDPEVRRTNNGDLIVNLTVATGESWKDKATGERKEKTEWHRVVIFNESLARVAEQYLKKGSKVYLEGQLQTRKWTDQQGVEKFSTEVVLQKFRGDLTILDGHKSASDEYRQEDEQDKRQAGSIASGSRLGGNDLDDDIPFEMEWR